MFTRPPHRTRDLVEQHRLLARVAELADEGRIRPTVTRELAPITADTLCEAHRLVESRHTLGKIVVHDWED